MAADDVRDRIRGVVAECLHLEPAVVGDDAQLAEEFGLDSHALLEIVTRLEYEFDIVIDDDDVRREKFSSVSAMSDLLLPKLG